MEVLFLLGILLLPPALLVSGLLRLWRGKQVVYDETTDSYRTDKPAGAAATVAIGAVATLAEAWVVSDLMTSNHSKGRVLRINGKNRTAPLRHGEGWAGDALNLDSEIAALALVERRAIGEAWLVAARMEHASIAAFSRLALRLISLGAPPTLIERTHAAAMDEILHARICFRVASSFLQEKYEPSHFADAVAPFRDGDTVSRLFRGSILDGALAEGVAAELARSAAEGVAAPELRRVLTLIATDEAKHAALGWDIALFCVEQSDLEFVMSEVLAEVRTPPETSLSDELVRGVQPQILSRYGVWTPELTDNANRVVRKELETKLSTLIQRARFARRTRLAIEPSCA